MNLLSNMSTQTCIVLCVLMICLTWIWTINHLGQDKCFCETLETPVAGIVRDCLKNRYCAVV